MMVCYSPGLMGLFMSAKREPRGERLRARMGFDLPDSVPPITVAATGSPPRDITLNSCTVQHARMLQSGGLKVFLPAFHVAKVATA